MKPLIVTLVLILTLIVGVSGQMIDGNTTKYGNEWIDYNKTYYLTVKFQIYNLFQKAMIWSILMYNKAERSETRTTDTGCVESCVTGAINSILFGSPAEINREEVLAEIFKKFAENLAKQ